MQFTWDKKFKSVGETEAADLKALLQEFLPDGKQFEFSGGMEYSKLTKISGLREEQGLRDTGGKHLTYRLEAGGGSCYVI